MQSSQPGSSSDATPYSSQTPSTNTDTPHSIITISTSVSQTDSQNSVISLSSAEDLFVNIQSSESNTSRPSFISAVQFEEFTEFRPSSVRYCQGLTIAPRGKSKSSNVTDIMIYMTERQESKLLPDSEESCPIYVLYKSNKILAILVDRVDPGQYLLAGLSKKFKISSGKARQDKNMEGIYVKKGKMSKYSGAVTSCNLADSQILVLGSFHKQPLMRKMISTKQSLTAKVALLQDDISQTLLEQTSPVKHEQIFLQIINDAAEQMVIVENKNKLRQLKAEKNKTNKKASEVVNETGRKRPHFQLRIVLKEKSNKRKRLLTDENQNSQSSVDSYILYNSSLDSD